MVSVECRGRFPAGMTRRAVAKLVDATFAVAGERGAYAMGVAAVGDADIRRLNASYRGKDVVTDVLSFGYDEDERELDLGKGGRTVRELGDVVICLPQVRRQARKSGRTVGQEFALMVVHGTLHLLGYDHETASQERTMFALQHETLLRAGIL